MIEVTQEDINRGCRGSLSNCPIARAVHRKIGAVWWGAHIEVGKNILLRGGSLHSRPTAIYNLPNEALEFIDTFDKGGPEAVEPFSFEAKCTYLAENVLETCPFC